jgi:hypothetical protein
MDIRFSPVHIMYLHNTLYLYEPTKHKIHIFCVHQRQLRYFRQANNKIEHLLESTQNNDPNNSIKHPKQYNKVLNWCRQDLFSIVQSVNGQSYNDRESQNKIAHQTKNK